MPSDELKSGIWQLQIGFSNCLRVANGRAISPLRSALSVVALDATRRSKRRNPKFEGGTELRPRGPGESDDLLGTSFC
jgi:hypothetical protein